MMLVSEVIAYLKEQFEDTDIYNGTIDKNKKECIGVYLRGNTPPYIALGGLDNTTFETLPLSILVHWTANADLCQKQAVAVYKELRQASEVLIGGRRVICFELLDAGPVDIQRDENNICEMIVRVNIIYERVMR